jgi:hypothetical protein
MRNTMKLILSLTLLAATAATASAAGKRHADVMALRQRPAAAAFALGAGTQATHVGETGAVLIQDRYNVEELGESFLAR